MASGELVRGRVSSCVAHLWPYTPFTAALPRPLGWSSHAPTEPDSADTRRCPTEGACIAARNRGNATASLALGSESICAEGRVGPYCEVRQLCPYCIACQCLLSSSLRPSNLNTRHSLPQVCGTGYYKAGLICTSCGDSGAMWDALVPWLIALSIVILFIATCYCGLKRYKKRFLKTKRWFQEIWSRIGPKAKILVSGLPEDARHRQHHDVMPRLDSRSADLDDPNSRRCRTNVRLRHAKALHRYPEWHHFLGGAPRQIHTRSSGHPPHPQYSRVSRTWVQLTYTRAHANASCRFHCPTLAA